jgi:hypothetical protein
MAKRKAATASRKAAATRAGAGRPRAGAAKKKTASRKATKRAAPRAAAAKRAKPGVSVRKTAGGRGTAARTATARTAKTAKTAKNSKAKGTKATKSAKASKLAKGSRPRSAPSPKTAAAVPLRKSPSLNRARRVVSDEDDDIVLATPPSSLDLNRRASSARSGRRTLSDRHKEHTETSPALTGGDVDADWESAYSVGDEAPGGDNPTPDQDIVDDIGKAVGIEYQDNEPLKGADKVEERDRKRWELDPASSEDYPER